jgi:hypothetical protein
MVLYARSCRYWSVQENIGLVDATAGMMTMMTIVFVVAR